MREEEDEEEGAMKRHHHGPAKTRVTDSGAVERVPNDAWNPDGWRVITEGMRARLGEPGVRTLDEVIEESE